MPSNLSNYLNYLLIAAAIGQAIQTQQATGSSGANKRAAAIKIVITSITPLIPAVAQHPEVAEHIGQLIDDFVALSKKSIVPVSAR